MRLLIACAECKRQYDATGRKAGSRFHCHCGTVVTVRQPTGHDARVVRCSSCGGPRQKGALRCEFCRSDFTLHERDLHTICPQCLARVSDRARFCHHCGIGLTPELEAGTPTKLVCPACRRGRRLVSRRMGAEAVTVLECGHCAGCWLGPEAFRQLSERVRKQSLAGTTRVKRVQAVAGSNVPVDSTSRSFYRPCVVCGELMNRRNYGGSSGVIVDLCRDHGLWFDGDELARVLAWLRAGGVPRPPGPSGDALPPEVRARLKRLSRDGEGPPSRDPFVMVLQFLGELFGRTR